MDFVQSIGFTRDIDAPKPGYSILGAQAVIPSDVIEEVARAYPKARSDFIMRKARRMHFTREREAYYKEASREIPTVHGTSGDDQSELEVNNGVSSGSSDLEEEPNLKNTTVVHIRPKPSPEFKQMLKYNPLQARVIETLWSPDEVSFAESIQPLMSLAKPEPFCVQYPHPVKPITKQGNCPYCSEDLKRLKSFWRGLHLLDCHCAVHGVRFCFDCAKFFKEMHQCPENDHTNTVYGVLVWRGLLIREGRCPFGSTCYKRRWKGYQNLKNHIESHLKRLVQFPSLCPHPTCQILCASTEEMRCHLHTVHKIRLMKQQARVSEIDNVGEASGV